MPLNKRCGSNAVHCDTDSYLVLENNYLDLISGLSDLEFANNFVLGGL